MIIRGAMLAFAGTCVMLAATSSPAKQAPLQVRLSGDRAKVEDEEGTGVYLIDDSAKVFASLGNPDRRVFGWDEARKRIRVSPLDRDGLWIQCIYVKAIPGKCPGGLPASAFNRASKPAASKTAPMSIVPRRAVTSSAVPGRSGRPTGTNKLPQCPGDPRCP